MRFSLTACFLLSIQSSQGFPTPMQDVHRQGATMLDAKLNSDYFKDLKMVLGSGGSASKNYMDTLSAKNALKKMVGSDETITGSSVGPSSYLDTLPHDDETVQPRGSGIISYLDGLAETQVGFGDICPGPEENVSTEARLFLIGITLLGLGIFCGPVMNLASWWRQQVSPAVLTVIALTLGTAIFVTVEEHPITSALYASVITATTIGYGDITPSTDTGKIMVALYSLVVVNVMGILLEPAKAFFEDLCRKSDAGTTDPEPAQPKKEL